MTALFTAGSVPALLLCFLLIGFAFTSHSSQDWTGALYGVILWAGMAVLIALALLTGAFNWAARDAVLRWVLVYAAAIPLGYCLFWVVAEGRGGQQQIGAVVTTIVVVYLMAAVFLQRDAGGPPVIVRQGGYLMMALAAVAFVSSGADHLRRQAVQREGWGREMARREAFQSEIARQQSAEFARLPADATVTQLLSMMNSVDRAVHAAVIARLKVHPELNSELPKLLEAEFSLRNGAAQFIAHEHPAPPASLGPAFARYMEQLLEENEWRFRQKNILQYDRGEVGTTLEAAERLVAAGADLRPQLQRYRETIEPLTGSWRHVRSIDRMLRTSEASARR